MSRFILWTLVIYVVWKIVQRFSVITVNKKTTTGARTASGGKNDFSNIPDAEFEDVTSKPPSETTK